MCLMPIRARAARCCNNQMTNERKMNAVIRRVIALRSRGHSPPAGWPNRPDLREIIIMTAKRITMCLQKSDRCPNVTFLHNYWICLSTVYIPAVLYKMSGYYSWLSVANRKSSRAKRGPLYSNKRLAAALCMYPRAGIMNILPRKSPICMWTWIHFPAIQFAVGNRKFIRAKNPATLTPQTAGSKEDHKKKKWIKMDR